MGAKQKHERGHAQHNTKPEGRPGKRWFAWWSVPADKFSFFIALFTFVLAIVGALQTMTLFNQLSEQKADRRPWLAPDYGIELTKPLTFDADGAHVEFRVTIRNGGKSIAKDVHTIGSLMIRPAPLSAVPERTVMPTSAIVAVMRQAMGPGCEPDVVRQFNTLSGSILLPDRTMPWPDQPMSVPKQQFALNRDGTVSAWIPVCVGYQDDLGQPHGTRFLLQYAAPGDKITFPPTGEVTGKFEVIGPSVDAY